MYRATLYTDLFRTSTAERNHGEVFILYLSVLLGFSYLKNVFLICKIYFSDLLRCFPTKFVRNPLVSALSLDRVCLVVVGTWQSFIDTL